MGLVVLALLALPLPAPAGDEIVVDTAHLADALSQGGLPPTYTLGGETMPVVAPPRERKTSVVFAGSKKPVTFPIPFNVGDGDPLVVSGVYHTQGSAVVPLPAAIIKARVTGGFRTGRIPAPVIARIPGTKTTFDLKLAPLPPSKTWKVATKPVAIPSRSVFEVSFGIAGSGRIKGAASLEFSVHLKRAGSDAEDLVIRKVLDPMSAQAKTWNSERAALDRFSGARASFIFRARALEAGMAALFPLVGDPRIAVRTKRGPTQRNVILISLDTLGARHLGTYGSQRRTSPGIDKLARSGVVFERVFSQWPETAGSHMSLFTSRFVSDHGVTNFVSQPPPTMVTLAQDLRRAGYLTKAFTEDGGVWAEAGFARGFDSYVEARSPDFVYRGEAARTFGAAGDWVRERAKHLFFLFVHTYQVHAPYRPPRGFRQALERPERAGPLALDELNYDREVAFTDSQVTKFIASLEATGVATATIVVLTSDHGEEFGEHGGRGHGRTLYSEVTHVPLIFWAPRFLAAKRVAEPAALVDVRPTILELLGLEAPAGPIAGRSLAATIGSGSHEESTRPIVSELDREGVRMLAVRNSGATLIRDLSTGKSRCYASTDGRESRPVDQGCDHLQNVASRHLASRGRGATQARTIDLDAETRAKLKALGYLQ